MADTGPQIEQPWPIRARTSTAGREPYTPLAGLLTAIDEVLVEQARAALSKATPNTGEQ